MKKSGWIILIIDLLLLGWIWQNKDNLVKTINSLTKKGDNKVEEQSVETAKTVETIVVTVAPSPTVVIPTKKPTAIPTIDNEPWGVAKQVNEVTWTMKVGEDEKMATAKEIFDALNEYRKVNGSQVLTWDEKLGNYAQSRAKYLNSIKNVDKHEGFNKFVEEDGGFEKLGFTMLGENISYGYKLNGVHTIEWMYAGDKPHNDNQLDNRWNFVGIGVDGLATCLIFGTGKM
jgi:uncharacterized protein YkwD